MKVEGKEYRALWFEDNSVKFIDQRKLPYKFEIFTRTAAYHWDLYIDDALIAAVAKATKLKSVPFNLLFSKQ